MILKTKLFGHVYEFKSIREVMAKANEEKSGDKLAGIAAETAEERVAAKVVLSNLTLNDLRNCPAVPYEEDEVTRIIQDSVNETIFNEYKNMTVAEFREWLLDTQTTPDMIRRASRGLTSEIVAGVCKLMSNLDLIYAAKKMRVTAHCNTTIGLPGTFSSRLQPNHTTDDPNGIIASVMEGLSLGCGDAVIGLNPVDDSVESVARILKMFDEFKRKWEVPTQICVLAHVTTQMEAVRQGAPCDLIFQSIAGSQKGNEAFGLDGKLIEEARQLALREGTATGPNVMYFETGQGSEVSIGADCGVDEMTLEARTYGFGRFFRPFMVNNVSGFIGPETLYDGKEMIRASLEDHFMGKLMGLPPCYTNHTSITQDEQEMATMLLNAAGANYYIGVSVNDDIMLSYQDTSYHDNATLRELSGRLPAPEFHQWMMKRGLIDEKGVLTELAGDASIFLQ